MKTKALVIEKEKALIYFLILAGLITFAPLLGNQFITGPIVNAILFIVTVLLGWQYGFLISFLPSFIALSTGLLPMVLLPVVSFIIVGNIILVTVFYFLKEKNYWLGVFWGSFSKFVFLFIASYLLVDFLNIPSQVAFMLSWPQFFTAFLGGVLAFLFLSFYGKTN